MATQIAGTDQVLMFPGPTDAPQQISKPQQTIKDESREREEERENVFRGFFYAMLFNLFLLLTFAAAWELWRIIR